MSENCKQAAPHTTRLPPWLRVPFHGGSARHEVKRLLRRLKLHTVCESATCPNLCDCWSRRTATFLLLGTTCTRNCAFCDVQHGTPAPPDPLEPENIALAVAELKLRYVVLTCVTRDDLDDGGAAHFAATIAAVRRRLPDTGIEVLTSDFQGRDCDIKTVVQMQPTVFNHNVETCARLTPLIRSNADFDRSLRVLRRAHELAQPGTTRIKSGFMLGLGEDEADIHSLLRDLQQCGVEILTVGQYLAPSGSHFPVRRYVHPDEFERWAHVARQDYRFAEVVSGPLVRSSYKADAMACRGEAPQ